MFLNDDLVAFTYPYRLRCLCKNPDYKSTYGSVHLVAAIDICLITNVSYLTIIIFVLSFIKEQF